MWLSFNIVDGDEWRLRSEHIESYGQAYKGSATGPSKIRTLSGDERVVRESVATIDDALRQAEVNWQLGMFPEPAPF